MTFINVDSSVMLYELALITAERKFQITVEALSKFIKYLKKKLYLNNSFLVSPINRQKK